jgi:secondary thiamine-phosphate synthase enzyme
MAQARTEIVIETRGRGLYEATGEVTRWVAAQEIAEGLLTLFLRHTSASLLIQENADPDVLRDLETFFARLVPDDPKLYRHVTEGADDMPAHIRAALSQTHLSIPVAGGRPSPRRPAGGAGGPRRGAEPLLGRVGERSPHDWRLTGREVRHDPGRDRGAGGRHRPRHGDAAAVKRPRADSERVPPRCPLEKAAIWVQHRIVGRRRRCLRQRGRSIRDGLRMRTDTRGRRGGP